jgi:3-oxoadipate enol-lactonase
VLKVARRPSACVRRIARTTYAQGVKTSSGVAHVNGAQLYYEESGSGPGLVLVHAGICDHRMWDPQVGAFAEHYRTIRYDARGYGRSSNTPGKFNLGADLAGLLNALDVDKAAVVGVSMGSMTAIDFALQEPEMARALVLGGGGVGGGKPSEEAMARGKEVEAAQKAGDLDTANELEMRLWVDGWDQLADRAHPAVRSAVSEMNRAILEREPETEDMDHQGLTPPAIERLGEISAPALVVIGDRDIPYLRDRAEKMARELPGARLAVVANAAHLPSMEHPADFNRMVLEFLVSV